MPTPDAIDIASSNHHRSAVDTDNIPTQDMIAWVGQGPISDRTQEHLSRSDKGVVMYHNLLLEQMERIERGEDPLGVIRALAENESMIDLRRERRSLKPFQSKYDTIFDKLEKFRETT